MNKTNLYPPIEKLKENTETKEEFFINPKKNFFGKSKEDQSDIDKFNRLKMQIDIGNSQLLETINFGNRQILFAIKELSNSIEASNKINFMLLNVIIKRTSFMDKGFSEKFQNFSTMEKRFSAIEKTLSQNSNEMLGIIPLKSESSKVSGNNKNTSSNNSAKSHPNFINNEINSNDSQSRRMTIYKRKKLKKMLMKGEDKKSSRLEAFHQLLDPKSVKKVKRPITSVVPKSVQNNKKDEN